MWPWELINEINRKDEASVVSHVTVYQTRRLSFAGRATFKKLFGT